MDVVSNVSASIAVAGLTCSALVVLVCAVHGVWQDVSRALDRRASGDR